jgi:CshA-type fibril repeat protein
LVSNTSTLAVGTNGVVNGAFNTPVVAVDDVSSGVQGAVQTINVKANDSAATGNNLTSPTIRFCSTDSPPSGCTLTSKTVSGQGSYSLSGGNVVFTPCSGANAPVMTPACAGAFSGTATPVGYQITDSGGQSAVATITPTVVPPPTANADVQTGSFDTNQTYTPAGNDTAGSGATVVASSVRLCPTSAVSPFTTSNCSASSVTTADGVYTVDTATGVVTFDPMSTFTGTASVSVRYVVQDSLNQTASATITPTVTPPDPSVANANTTSGVVGATQSVNLLTNDSTPSGVTFTASSTRLCAVGVVAPNCVSTSLDVPSVGSYSLSGGTVTFTPCTTSVTANCASGVAFTGTATPVGYQVSDSVGRTVSSTYTPSVVPPPTALADAQSGAFDTNQTYTPHGNDTAGSDTSLAVSPAGICLSSVTVASSCAATTLNVAGEGSYTLDTATGVVTFDPDPTFAGTATSIKYVATDILGQKVLSTITPTVTPPDPSVANANTTSGVVGAAQNVNLLTNDTTAVGVSLTASSTRLCAVGVSAPNCVSTSLDVANVGSYSLVNGTVTFTPCGVAVTSNCASGVAFTGTASPVGYQVSDSVGRTVSSTYTPTVVPPPVSSPDGSQGVRGEPQTITLISNDAPGVDTSPLLPASIRLCDTNETAPNCSKTELVVPGEGSYRLNPNGTVVFTPDPTFEGSATPIRYMASDELGQSTTSTVVAKVVPPPAPITDDDTKTGPPNRPIVFDPAANDTPGVVPAGQSGRVTLVRTSLRLCDAGQLVPNCTATTLATADGTYTVDIATGWVTFTPRTGFEGVATRPVTYQIANDWTGPTGIGIASAVITPIVDQQASPSALPTTGGIPVDPTGIVFVLFAIGIVVAASASRRRHLLG